MMSNLYVIVIHDDISTGLTTRKGLQFSHWTFLVELLRQNCILIQFVFILVASIVPVLLKIGVSINAFKERATIERSHKTALFKVRSVKTNLNTVTVWVCIHMNMRKIIMRRPSNCPTKAEAFSSTCLAHQSDWPASLWARWVYSKLMHRTEAYLWNMNCWRTKPL